MAFRQILKIVFIVVAIVALCLGVEVAAQETNNPTLTPAPLTSKSLENQAEVVKVKQASETELQNLIIKLEAENEDLNKQVLGLKKQQTELEVVINKFTQNLNDLKLQDVNNSPNLQSELDLAKQELENSQKDLIVTKNDLAEKQAKYDANINTIQEAKANLISKKQEVNQEVNALQQQVIIFGTQVSYYLVLISAYWLIWQLARVINQKLIKNEFIHSIFSFVINFLAISATFITITLAFIGNLTILLTSLGVFSAALVVALQDFVSSFFAWIMIVVSRQYRLGDTIAITTGKGIVSGVVARVGIFRTTLKEKLGGDGWDSEFPTGRILTFPNNLVLKESVTNYTRENDIIWHSLSVTITFESDRHKAKEILEDICTQQFRYALDHEQQYFKGAINTKQYKPRVYMNIANDGPQYTIWFATKIGYFRDRVEKYSEDILTKFNKAGIELAYTTNRVMVNKTKN
jgi:small-conductance mechanosensitive channel